MYGFVGSDFSQYLIDTFNSIMTDLAKIWGTVDANYEGLADLGEMVRELTEKVDALTTMMYIALGVLALVVVLQIVILVKISRKSEKEPKKQLPAPEKEPGSNGKTDE